MNTNIDVDIDDSPFRVINALDARLWSPGMPVHRHPRLDMNGDGTYVRQMLQWYEDVSVCGCDTDDCEFWSMGKAMVWERDGIAWGWDVDIAPAPAAWTWAQPAW
jgi:hypothetical protein